MKNLKCEETGFVAVVLDEDGNFVEGLREGTSYCYDICSTIGELVITDTECDFDIAKEIFTKRVWDSLQIVKVKKSVSIAAVEE